MKNPHYTVLGARGFIGGHLVKAIQQSGAECYAPTRDDYDIFTKDLGHVFYCVGLTADYRDRPFDTVEAHVSLLSRILERSSFDKLIYLSSTRLYDGLEGDICRESDNLKLNTATPRHLYDFSKGLGENICLTASKGRACVARLSAVYDICPEATGFLPGVLHKLQQEREFTIDSSTGISRDYICVDDVIAALLKMSQETNNEIVNVASGENISNQDIIDCLNAEGFNLSAKSHSAPETRPRCDISKITKLGIHPISVKSYIKNLIRTGALHGTR